MNIILIIEGVLFVYDVYSNVKIVIDFKRQREFYLKQGYSQAEANNLAAQDIGPALITQVTMFPELSTTSA